MQVKKGNLEVKQQKCETVKMLWEQVKWFFYSWTAQKHDFIFYDVFKVQGFYL